MNNDIAYCIHGVQMTKTSMFEQGKNDAKRNYDIASVHPKDRGDYLEGYYSNRAKPHNIEVDVRAVALNNPNFRQPMVMVGYYDAKEGVSRKDDQPNSYYRGYKVGLKA